MSWTTARARWFPLVVVMGAVLSCSPGEDPPTDLPPGVVEGSPTIAVPTAAPSATVTPATADCPNEAAVAEDPARQTGPSSRADVDGDGIQDTVRLASDPTGPEGCTSFLVVDLGDVSIISAPVWEVGREGGLPQPRIHGFANIDGQPGDEILVDEAAGASTQFVGAFVHVDGDLERVTARGGVSPEAGPFQDLFAYGGSVGHIEAVDCSTEGVVVSTAVPSGEAAGGGSVAYEVERRFFAFDGAVLEEEQSETKTVRIEELDRFPEYAAGPFGSC